ncbi:MAG TPA: HAMP domain-containing sensor histidine kinase [Oligoflexus sp.]|uniref:sensor histidine kinase n=1 Tax=Oligoflexus sp. TaxID=1971216 RepID=UPI002D800F7C|nr:HAMP domain-containing sensor histidine kinase [Oligoflexus sp.]HET9236178.1 HAMP domain-containing sensor histidine kinase [Oligoflexus sp.]
MLQQIRKFEIEAQRRQIRKIMWSQLVSDSFYALIFIAGQRYFEFLLLLAFQVPIHFMLRRLSVQVDSRLKCIVILLQHLTFFVFAAILGEKALVQLLSLSAFLSQIIHLRPKRWMEWAAVLLAPILWNILEWRDYDIFQLPRTHPEWMITAIRLGILNSSFIFLYLIFDFLRLRHRELENEMVASGMNLQQAKATIERQQSALVQNSKMQALGEMAGGIAHEINNPLSIIVAQLYALKARLIKGMLSAQELQESLHNLQQSSGRISHIVQSLLQISGDGARDPFQNVSVLALLDHTEALCRQKFQHYGIELTVAKHIPETLMIPCHQSQIAQVLLNLLSNAFDAVAEAQERWVRVWTVHDSERVVFIVTDSGQGVLPQQKERLFQPFSSTKPIGKGMGLGLSISKGIVEQHHGNIWLDTSARYTTFKMELPLVSGPAPGI